SLLVVPLRRARTASGFSFKVPFSANFPSDFSIPANPLSRYFCSTSSTVTSNPAIAATCAMPDPINPQPSTPTFLISISVLIHHRKHEFHEGLRPGFLSSFVTLRALGG